MPDVICQPLIFFFIEEKFLTVVPFLDALNVIGGIVIADTGSMDSEIILLVADVLAIDRIEITFAERKVMNGIQKVGFPYPVVTDKAIDLIRELVISL
jgi:hypothetical protein